MHKTLLRTAVSAFALATATPVLVVAQADQAHMHVGHVTTSFNAAPDAQGLLPVALAEARTAVQHAGLAADDPSNLQGMKTHAGHVLHALSPAEGSQGPGQGFGVKSAAEAIATHIGLAADAQGASQNVTTHAAHVGASARTVVQRTDAAVALVEQIQAATVYSEAAPVVEELVTLTNQIISGHDANGDGSIGWEEGEGGLEQAEQHMGLLASAEGL